MNKRIFDLFEVDTQQNVQVLNGDCLDVLKTLPDQSVNCCITSPPYYNLRNYDEEGQIGLEETMQEYIDKLVNVFREVRRVLKDDGTVWLNLGDSYNGSGGNHKAHHKNDSGFQGKVGVNYGGNGNNDSTLKPKDLMGIPWRVAFALQDDGWWLRQDIIWQKGNPMPEPVTDRCVKAHEYIFLLSKNKNYYFDHHAIREEAVTDIGNAKIKFGGNKYGDSDDPKHATKSGNVYEPDGKRNKRSVWTVNTKPFKDAHFATYPPELITPCILAGCPENGTVLDPFAGSGTTGVTAEQLQRKAILIELNPEYVKLIHNRLLNCK